MPFKFHLAAASFGLAALLGGAVHADEDKRVHEDNQAQRDLSDDEEMAAANAATTDPARVLQMIHFIAQYDIKASQLAMERASNEDVKDFAKDVIEDWNKLDKRTVATASELGFALNASTELPASSKTGDATDTGSTWKHERTTETESSSELNSDGTRRSEFNADGTRRSDVNPDGTRKSESEEPSSDGIRRTEPGSSTELRTDRDFNNDTKVAATGEDAKRQEALRRLERLQSLSGKEFDREYLSLMTFCADSTRTKLDPIHKAIADKDDDASDKVDDIVEDVIEDAEDHREDADDLIEDLND
jgi:predicted outer membrane protein